VLNNHYNITRLSFCLRVQFFLILGPGMLKEHAVSVACKTLNSYFSAH